MQSLLKKINVFGKDERGVTMLEYALIAGLVALIAIAGITTLGVDLNAKFGQIATAVNGAGGAPSK